MALALLAWLAGTAWMRPRMLPDEGRYIGVAWEMLRVAHAGGSWLDVLTPTLNGLPYFHKPPLFYALTAAAMEWLGPTRLAGRMASLLGAALAILSVHALLRRRGHRRQADRLLLGLAVQPLMFIGAQFANLDMLVAGCITATICLAAEAAFRLDAGLEPGWPLPAAWATAALGVLAKGLIGIVLPGLVVSIWLLVWRRPRLLVRLLSPAGPLLFALLAAPWFLAMQWRWPGFGHYFFVIQHLQRFAGGGFNNVQPFWFYAALLVLAMLPWAPAAWRALRMDWRRERRPLPLLLAVWVLVVLLFFSWPASKLVGYILPAVPPLMALAAGSVQPAQARGWLLGSALAGLLSLTAVGVLARHDGDTSDRLGRALGQQVQPGALVIALDDLPFDLPVTARLGEPMLIVLDRDDPRRRAGDGWARELVDAAGFNARAAARTLLAPDALQPTLCAATAPVWLVGRDAATARWTWLAQAETIASQDGRRLWRLPSVSGCARTPSVAPPTR